MEDCLFCKIIKGEIPLDKRNVDNYPILKKARFYEEK